MNPVAMGRKQNSSVMALLCPPMVGNAEVF